MGRRDEHISRISDKPTRERKILRKGTREIICFYCGGIGHMKSNCFIRRKDIRKRFQTNINEERDEEVTSKMSSYLKEPGIQI
ncbi:hypothetical protein J0J21_23070 [Vibrio vulnificus]|nr:hypothetical protein [Vibrio vulnificus]